MTKKPNPYDVEAVHQHLQVGCITNLSNRGVAPTITGSTALAVEVSALKAKIAQLEADLTAARSALRAHQEKTLENIENEIHDEDFARVGPSVPCVAPAGSTAEQQSGTVTAAERTEFWSVTVDRNGEQVVTLASTHLSGRDLSAEDERVIRMAAEHLAAFIGAPGGGCADDAAHLPQRDVLK